MDTNTAFLGMGSLIKRNPDYVYKRFERQKDAVKYSYAVIKDGGSAVRIIPSEKYNKWYVIYLI